MRLSNSESFAAAANAGNITVKSTAGTKSGMLMIR